MRDSAAVRAAFDAVEKELGPVNQLINNAAGNFLCSAEDLSDGAFNSVVQIVLYGSFYCTRELGRRLIERKHRGEILSIVTTYTQSGSAFVVPSAAAKAGVLAMVRSLAVEWAAYGIRLNAVAPGPFPTEGAFTRLMPGSELERQALRRVPLRRFGEHYELTNLDGLPAQRRQPLPDRRPRHHRRGGGALLRPAVRGIRPHGPRAAKEMMAALKPKK